MYFSLVKMRIKSSGRTFFVFFFQLREIMEVGILCSLDFILGSPSKAVWRLLRQIYWLVWWGYKSKLLIK